MIKATYILILLMNACLAVRAQNSDLQEYMEDNYPDSLARIFAPGIISTDKVEHSSPAFSPDGRTVIWAIMKLPSYQTCLLEMNLDGDEWSLPHAPAFSNSLANEVYPNFSSDGDTLFFCSDRRIVSTSSQTSTLWYTIRNSNRWSPAKVLDQKVFEKDVYANSIAKSGNRYFTIGPHGTSDWDIYRADKQGIVTPLAYPINTDGFEDGPFIAPDESYLIFESDRPTEVGGNIDLYISFRKKDGTWADPVNMGPRINTSSDERFAKVSPDGSHLFFGRNTGQGFDIYWISAGIIEDLESIELE